VCPAVLCPIFRENTVSKLNQDEPTSSLGRLQMNPTASLLTRESITSAALIIQVDNEH